MRPTAPFLLIEQIRPTTAEVDDLGTPIAILLESHAAEAVESITDTLTAAHHAFILIISEAALVADACERRRSHVGVADWTLAIAFIAEPADVDSRHLAAHH